MEKDMIKEYVETRAKMMVDRYIEVEYPRGKIVIEHLSEDHRKFIILQESDFLPKKQEI